MGGILKGNIFCPQRSAHTQFIPSSCSEQHDS